MKTSARTIASSPTSRPDVPTRRAAAQTVALDDEPQSQSKLAWPAAAFLICAFIPWLFSIGSVIVSPYRIVLLVTTLPCLWMWVRGKAGGIRSADIMILLYCIWCMTALFAVHGAASGLQSGGIIAIESAGAYFLGRCFIRNARQFYAMVRLFFLIVVILFPFAIIETVSNTNVLLNFFSKFAPTLSIVNADPRWGLRRVQSVFEHPILFAVTCGAILAFVHMVLGETMSPARRWMASGAVVFMAFLSLSSGPLTALMAQMFLIFWNWILRNNEMRWRILWGLFGIMYVAISLVSNQTVPEFLLTHFSFDQASAYYRVLIWHFGSESAMNNPVFGVGFNRWERPVWMPESIDMFWLYHAVRFGIPASIFMLLAFMLTVIPISRRKDLDPRFALYRTAFLIVMTAYFLVGWTVHFWNATCALYLFLLGSGAWLLDVRSEGGPASTGPQSRRDALAAARAARTADPHA